MVVSGKEWPGYAKGTIPDEGFEWKWIDATPPDILNRDPPTGYIPLGYSKEILPKGWKKTPENKALDLDITFEKDVEVTLRDGVKVHRLSPLIVDTRSMLIFTALPILRGPESPSSSPTLPTAKGALVRTSWTLCHIELVFRNLDKAAWKSSKVLILTNGVDVDMLLLTLILEVHLILKVTSITLAKKIVSSVF
jgi:hypothetical protein